MQILISALFTMVTLVPSSGGTQEMEEKNGFNYDVANLLQKVDFLQNTIG